MRRLVATLAVALLALALSGGAALAAGDENTETARVPGTDVALDYPTGWVAVPIDKLTNVKAVRAYLKRHPKLAAMMSLDASASDADLREFIDMQSRYRKLTRIDTTSGDNVIVSLMPGPWWDGLAEWKHSGELSAKSTNGVVLSDAKTSVGGHPAYTHLERDADGIYGYMEIKQPDGKAVTISITTDEVEPAQAILDSVRPARTAREAPTRRAPT